MRRWPYWTPPGWLRHFVSWRLLSWIDRHFLVCWSRLCDWKFHGPEEGTNAWPGIDRGCFHPYDYCGKYDKGGKCAAYRREAWEVYQNDPELNRVYYIAGED